MSGKDGSVAEKMKEAWLNEKNSPELLQYEGELVSTLLAKLETQQGYINEGMDNENDQFKSYLIEMESERVKYVLRCYLRTRLAKIEKYFRYVLDPDAMIHQRLSDHELEYAEKYKITVENHMEKSILHLLPEGQRGLEDKDKTVGYDMISKPNLNEFTFCQVLQDIGDFQLNEVDSVLLMKDEIYILSYKTIKPLLESGKIRLL